MPLAPISSGTRSSKGADGVWEDEKDEMLLALLGAPLLFGSPAFWKTRFML